MNLSPPLAMRTYSLEGRELTKVEKGICPFCPQPKVSPKEKRLKPCHEDGGLKFLQCSKCLVIVVLAA